MLCLKPITVGTAGPFGCGQCLPCRINRRREWTARLLLQEAGHVGGSAFVTLTYSDKELPKNERGQAVLRAVDMRNFLQRLRRATGVGRYVFVGEYGERTMRPHFHLLHWSLVRGLDERLYADCWRLGFVHVGEVTEDSIAYTIGYVLKAMQKVEDPRLEGRPPEFARFSHGLASDCCAELKRVALVDAEGQMVLPREFRVRGKVWPIPRYVRKKLEAEGYGFIRSKSELEEAEFVQRLRACAAVVAADEIGEFRKDRVAGMDARRARSAARLTSNLIRKRYETF